MKKSKKYINELHNIENKIVIITGSNSGLGYQMAKISLIKGAYVVMACRNKVRAEDAKEKLIKETNSEKIIIEEYDQSNIASIHNFAKTIQNKYPNFYALVLNAGIMRPQENVDEFHISNVYKTNFIGAKILLDDLDNFIQETSEEKRIIIQGSLATFIYEYKNKNKFIYGEYNAFKQYCLSKCCCSNLFVYYRDKNKNPYVKYLLCEPGVASTMLFKNCSHFLEKVFWNFCKFCSNDSETGSLSGCKLICDVVANGDYYHPKHLFTIKGLPKKDTFPKKYIFPSIISDAKDIIEMYDKEQ